MATYRDLLQLPNIGSMGDPAPISLNPVQRGPLPGMPKDYGENPVQRAALRPDPSYIGNASQGSGSEKVPAYFNQTPFLREVYLQGMAKGYQPHQLAAIAGHAMAESKGMSDAMQRGGKISSGGAGGHGAMQWDDRAPALKKYAAAYGVPWTDPKIQAQFMFHEMDTTERRAGEALRSSRNFDEASRAVLDFERPQGWKGYGQDPTGAHQWKNRVTYGQQALASIQGDGRQYASATPTSPSGTGGGKSFEAMPNGAPLPPASSERPGARLLTPPENAPPLPPTRPVEVAAPRAATSAPPAPQNAPAASPAPARGPAAWEDRPRYDYGAPRAPGAPAPRLNAPSLPEPPAAPPAPVGPAAPPPAAPPISMDPTAPQVGRSLPPGLQGPPPGTWAPPQELQGQGLPGMVNPAQPYAMPPDMQRYAPAPQLLPPIEVGTPRAPAPHLLPPIDIGTPKPEGLPGGYTPATPGLAAPAPQWSPGAPETTATPLTIAPETPYTPPNLEQPAPAYTPPAEGPVPMGAPAGGGGGGGGGFGDMFAGLAEAFSGIGGGGEGGGGGGPQPMQAPSNDPLLANALMDFPSAMQGPNQQLAMNAQRLGQPNAVGTPGQSLFNLPQVGGAQPVPVETGEGWARSAKTRLFT